MEQERVHDEFQRADELSAAIWNLKLVDHHVHGASKNEMTRQQLEVSLTEADRVPQSLTQFDSQVGFAIRRWCAPVLDLSPHASADDYVSRRLELGNEEVNRRLLRASGIGHFLNDTGAFPDKLLGTEEMRVAADADVDEIVRLEWSAVELVRQGVSAAEFPQQFRDLILFQTRNAVGMKSIVAYLHGFGFDPSRPSDDEVRVSAQRWLPGAEEALERGDTFTAVATLVDPVLLRFFLWCGVDRGLPLQLHTGYGSHPIHLDRANPLMLIDWLKQIEPLGIDVLLLHCYPYHREAGYLAQIFTNVYFDVGLTTNYTGVQSDAIIAESLELAPFGKVLFSSDAWGPAELHHLGALLWRRGMEKALGRWVKDGDWNMPDAIRVVRMIGSDNARRVYSL